MQVMIPLLGLTIHGGNRVLVRIANGIVEAGHTCEIFTTHSDREASFRIDPRVQVRRIGPSRAPKLVRWLCMLVALPWHARTADRLIANHFLTTVPSWFAGRIWRFEVLYLVQDIEYRFYRIPLRWVAFAICRWSWGRRGIVAANPYVSAELARLGARVEHTLRLGLDPIFLDASLERCDQPVYDVVCFLRGEHHKRADRLLGVVTLLRSKGRNVLCICQDKGLAARYGNSFDCIESPTSDYALVKLYDSARIFLLTSEHEGFALPPLECMARGVPSVMFPCGGPSIYAISGVNCIVIEDQTEEAAVSEILALLGDEERYQKLSAAGRVTARNLEISGAVRALLQIINHDREGVGITSV